MINTLQEIQDRFEKIKDHKPKASKKLNELGDILASAKLANAAGALATTKLGAVNSVPTLEEVKNLLENKF